MSSAAHSPPEQAYEIGYKIAGKYRVEGVLGSGGMGVVYAARHEDLGQLFAIKFLRPQQAGSKRSPDTLVSRFVREARAAAQIQSDHVVRVFDVGTLENGEAYMVMEHLSGQDLDRLLEKERALPIEQAVSYVMEALDAVAHAHALGIVHRDLKPSNLFVSDRPDGSKRIKVLDFGISKVRSDLDRPVEGKALTTGDAVLGSPGYMAPEQVRKSKNADARSDIWSMGVILYELLTGVQPFRGETVGEILASILDGAVEAPSRLRADIPRGLEASVLRCLMRNPADRFADVPALASALSAFCDEPHREMARRIEAVLKGANGAAKADALVRISLAPGSDRVSQTAETMDAIVSAQAAADMPRLEQITLSASFVGGREPKTPAPEASKRRFPVWVLGAALFVPLLLGLVLMSRRQDSSVGASDTKVSAGIMTERPSAKDGAPSAVSDRAAALAPPEIKPAAEASSRAAETLVAPAPSHSASAPAAEKPLSSAAPKSSAKSAGQAPKPKAGSSVPTDLLRERD